MGIDRCSRKGASGRDPGGFIAIPWSVLDSEAYISLSHTARSLLLEIARQFVRDNNGRLLASAAFLKKRGWKSNDVITRAKRELLNNGFICETVKGCRPNKASWYAVTWHALDKHKGYDSGVIAAFERSAYRNYSPEKISALKPSRGAKHSPIAPCHGLGTKFITPPNGAIRLALPTLSTPLYGDHLEIPSAVEIQAAFV